MTHEAFLIGGGQISHIVGERDLLPSGKEPVEIGTVNAET